MKKILFSFCFMLTAMGYGDVLLDGSWRIVLPEKVDLTMKFAAEEMQWHIQQITGKKPAIIPYTKNASKAVYLQFTPKTDPERWTIRTRGNRIIISGGYPRGVQYGVYELMERYASCRYFTPKVSRIPKAKHIKLPSNLTLSGQPWFLHRYTSFLMTMKQASVREWKRYFARTRFGMNHYLFRLLKDPEYLYSNRIGSPGMTHTFYAYQKDWKDVKPEYYALLKNGKRAPRMQNAGAGAQFCLTNPELRDRFFRQLLTFIKQDREKARQTGLPYPIFYALSPNDNNRFCHCPPCKKFSRAEDDYTDAYVDFIIDMANRLKKVHPDVMIRCGGYMGTKRPPTRTLPKNAAVGMAFLDSEFLRDENADSMRPLTHPVNRVALQYLQGWAKKSPGGVNSHQYGSHFTLQYRIPCDVTRKIDADLKLYKKYNSRAVTFEMSDRDSSFFWLRRYVLARLVVDPDLPLETLVQEFMEGYYGPAAKPMRAYYDMLAEGTPKVKDKISMTPVARIEYLTESFFRKADRLLDQAEKLAGKDRRIRNAVQDERMVLDGIRIYNYDLLKVPIDRKVLLNRYLSAKKRLGDEEGFYSFKADIHHTFITYGGIDCERAVLETPVPEQFKGKKVFSWFAISMRRGKVKDPEAAGGVALKLGKKPYQRKLRLKLHDSQAHKDLHREVHLTTFPKDEKYHFYYVHTADLYPRIIFWTNLFQTYMSWATLPPPANRMAIYASVKFTGPTFVPGSKKPDGIFIDRLIAVAVDK